MARPIPCLSTDQVAAFVELARQGSLRKAAGELNISEQGLRNRLLVLESRLKVELYRKRRGMRRATQLTQQGKQFLPQALAFLERAEELAETFAQGEQAVEHEVHVAASQYLTLYLLIDSVRRFHAAYPGIRVRLSTRTEQAIEEALLIDPDVTIGVCAPYEASPELEYTHLFTMDWSLITPRRHALMQARQVTLADLADQPLILFERGSTGRQHVIDAFHEHGLTPRVDMEMTSTQIIVRMVEAGLGISVVPLLPSGAVTKGCRVGVRGLGRQIRPIRSGILTRRGDRLPPASRTFVEFVRRPFGTDPSAA